MPGSSLDLRKIFVPIVFSEQKNLRLLLTDFSGKPILGFLVWGRLVADHFNGCAVFRAGECKRRRL